MNNTSSDCVGRSLEGGSFNVIQVVLYTITIIISFVGNSAVIYCVYYVKSMRTFTNILICNAAVADLLITLVPTIHEVVKILVYKEEWVLGGFMCSFLYMCVYLSVAATVLTLVVVAVDRFCAVLLPYKKYLKIDHLTFVIPSIWIAAFLFSSPTVFIQKVIEYEGKNICIEIWPEPFNQKEAPKHYTIILFVCLYAIPLTLMGFLYTSIAFKLTSKSNLNAQSTVRKTRKFNVHTSTETVILNTPILCPKEKKRANIRQKKRVIYMLTIVVISFAICWLPVYVIQFFMFFHPYFIRCHQSMPSWAIFLAFLMQYANSAINPLIYFGYSHSYRSALKKTMNAFGRPAKSKRYKSAKSQSSSSRT